MKMWLRLGLLVGLGAPAVRAVDWSALLPQGYVSDFAHLVDPATRVRLETYCGAVEQAAGAQIMLVIVPSLQGEPVADVAQSLYRGWEIGQKVQGRGVLLLMAVRDRRVRIATGRGLESIVPEGRVLREMRPALREGDFGDAAMAAAETIGVAVAKARRVNVSASLPRRYRPGILDWFPWPLLIGVVFLLIWLMRMGGVRGDGTCTGGGLLPALLRGRTTTRSTWGGNGRGGFGGYDSGDARGAFGGGDCAGTAASDW